MHILTERYSKLHYLSVWFDGFYFQTALYYKDVFAPLGTAVLNGVYMFPNGDKYGK